MHKMLFRFSCLFFSLLLSSGALYGCGEDFSDYPAEVVGVWRSDGGEDRYYVLVFNADGTGSSSVFIEGQEKLPVEFTYTLEGDTLVRHTSNDELREKLFIKGDTLRLPAGKHETVYKKAS